MMIVLNDPMGLPGRLDQLPHGSLSSFCCHCHWSVLVAIGVGRRIQKLNEMRESELGCDGILLC
jgi:hypothetical protein